MRSYLSGMSGVCVCVGDSMRAENGEYARVDRILSSLVTYDTIQTKSNDSIRPARTRRVKSYGRVY